MRSPVSAGSVNRDAAQATRAHRRGFPYGLLAAAFASMCASAAGRTPQTEQGAEGIVHAAPVASVSPEPATQPFSVVGKITGALTSAATVRCSLDVVSGQPAPMAMVIDHRVPLTLVGWAGDVNLGVPRSVVFLLMGTDNTFGVEGKPGLPRPDVVDATHKPEFASSGYSIAANPEIIPQGEYHAALIERFGGVEHLCPLNRTIAVK